MQSESKIPDHFGFPRSKLNLLQLIGVAILGLWLLSLLNLSVGVFAISYGLYGGTPQNGLVEGGHYYVGNHSHYYLVSREFYERDKIYVDVSEKLPTVATLALVFLIATLRIWRQKRGNS